VSKVTELIVNGLWAAPKDNGVDLDGLCLMTRPDGIDDWTEEKRRQWLNDNGYDLSVDLGDKGVWLHAVATNLASILNAQWKDESLSWIADTLQPGSLSSPLIFWQLPEDVLPITFAFRTMDGTSGVFRVTAYSVEDKKATIQIRLAQA
jgi:hypothetical protein